MTYYDRLKYRRYGINPCVIVSSFQEACRAEWEGQKLNNTWTHEYELPPISATTADVLSRTMHLRFNRIQYGDE